MGISRIVGLQKRGGAGGLKGAAVSSRPMDSGPRRLRQSLNKRYETIMQNVDSFDRERRPVVRGEYAAREAALAAAESLRWHGDSAADTREYEQRDADRGSHVEEGRERVGGKGGVGQLVDTRFEDRQRTPRGSYQQHDNLQRASLAQRSELYSMGADDRRAFVEANPEKLESPVGDGCTKLQAYRYEVNREPNTRGPAARKPRVVKNVMNQTRQARISLPAEKVSSQLPSWLDAAVFGDTSNPSTLPSSSTEEQLKTPPVTIFPPVEQPIASSIAGADREIVDREREIHDNMRHSREMEYYEDHWRRSGPAHSKNRVGVDRRGFEPVDTPTRPSNNFPYQQGQDSGHTRTQNAPLDLFSPYGKRPNDRAIRTVAHQHADFLPLPDTTKPFAKNHLHHAQEEHVYAFSPQAGYPQTRQPYPPSMSRIQRFPVAPPYHYDQLGSVHHPTNPASHYPLAHNGPYQPTHPDGSSTWQTLYQSSCEHPYDTGHPGYPSVVSAQYPNIKYAAPYLRAPPPPPPPPPPGMAAPIWHPLMQCWMIPYHPPLSHGHIPSAPTAPDASSPVRSRAKSISSIGEAQSDPVAPVEEFFNRDSIPPSLARVHEEIQKEQVQTQTDPCEEPPRSRRTRGKQRGVKVVRVLEKLAEQKSSSVYGTDELNLGDERWEEVDYQQDERHDRKSRKRARASKAKVRDSQVVPDVKRDDLGNLTVRTSGRSLEENARHSRTTQGHPKTPLRSAFKQQSSSASSIGRDRGTKRRKVHYAEESREHSSPTRHVVRARREAEVNAKPRGLAKRQTEAGFDVTQEYPKESMKWSARQITRSQSKMRSRAESHDEGEGSSTDTEDGQHHSDAHDLQLVEHQTHSEMNDLYSPSPTPDNFIPVTEGAWAQYHVPPGSHSESIFEPVRLPRRRRVKPSALPVEMRPRNCRGQWVAYAQDRSETPDYLRRSEEGEEEEEEGEEIEMYSSQECEKGDELEDFGYEGYSGGMNLASGKSVIARGKLMDKRYGAQEPSHTYGKQLSPVREEEEDEDEEGNDQDELGNDDHDEDGEDQYGRRVQRKKGKMEHAPDDADERDDGGRRGKDRRYNQTQPGKQTLLQHFNASQVFKDDQEQHLDRNYNDNTSSKSKDRHSSALRTHIQESQQVRNTMIKSKNGNTSTTSSTQADAHTSVEDVRALPSLRRSERPSMAADPSKLGEEFFDTSADGAERGFEIWRDGY